LVKNKNIKKVLKNRALYFIIGFMQPGQGPGPDGRRDSQAGKGSMVI
jgi:hypothetical protein